MVKTAPETSSCSGVLEEKWLIRVLRSLLWIFFRLFFRVEYSGRENVPDRGPCIIAPNHRTYFDPLLVGLGLNTLAHYMAWERLFRIPLLGHLLPCLGAFPVDILRPDKSSYRQSLQVLRQNGFLVVFPEGGRTRTELVDRFKPGVARLALATGAVLVPCTILGGDRVWPRHRSLPRPGKIRVIFHPPCRLIPANRRDPAGDRTLVADILADLRQTLMRPMAPPGAGGQEIAPATPPR